MSVCCINCFEDDILHNLINEKGILSDCDYCNSTDVMCIEISQLESLFRCFTEIYDETTYGEHYGIGQDADDNGVLLIDLIQNDWRLFSDHLDYDKQLDLLFEILNSNPLNEDEPLDKNSLYSDEQDSITYIRNEEIWNEFCENIKYENRFFIDGYWWDESIYDTFEIYAQLIEADTIFYRARLGGVKRETKLEPYPINEMGMPSKEKTRNGRANPVGIPYLYLGSDPITVIAEVRPWKGANVSVATIKLIKEVKILDLTKKHLFNSPFECNNLKKEVRNRDLLKLLSMDLAKPINPEIADIEYVPTQFLVEFIKNIKKFEGIKFKSSLGPGDNIIFFNEENVEFMNTGLYKVEDIHYTV